MPYSSPVFDAHIEAIFRAMEPRVFLDIGAGSGKYGTMIRRASPETRSIGIEPEPQYIEKFNLRSIYTDILEMRAEDLINPRFYDNSYDLVVIGDTIEHLKKSAGIDLLNFLIYRTRWILIQFPHKYLQNTWEGFSQEAHISAWSEHDFLSFEKTKLYRNETQRLILLRGYLEETVSTEKVERFLESKEEPLAL